MKKSGGGGMGMLSVNPGMKEDFMHQSKYYH
jgi:hypothetical protein